MAKKFRISGVWKDGNGGITHYAIHDVTDAEKRNIDLAKKTAKAEAIKLVETAGNTVTTIVWNYVNPGWYATEDVHVVGTGTDKYLRSDPDKRLTDNLGHLPNYALIF
ncbi:DUF3892 domain-containing protein [Hymenobacter lutimineralis]|uniref:DUF3892 domain-containing protein n=1 Tax=Hymenobacter lutimineralis TaxID=2606448 RepID=A0A5D6V9X9_9BACT|nr:DUF3892 domain-containing protein [Hymenobacter lutimineralis]TYZ12683.1 DUF3892 domain-containing protein [Hymenobacter lutimineralis]